MILIDEAVMMIQGDEINISSWVFENKHWTFRKLTSQEIAIWLKGLEDEKSRIS